MDPNALERQESYQYPAGHLGRLSQNQQHALDSFKRLCQENGYYSPTGSGGRPTHDDETLLRYLRARKFVPQDAFVQFKDTEDWRKDIQIDNIYETIDVKEYHETSLLYPQWTGRRDKRGIPVYVFEVASLTSKRMSEYEKSFPSGQISGSSNTSAKMIRLFALYENLTKFALPFCAAMPDRPYPETPVSQSNNIVDISHVGLSQFWNLKDHMQAASTLATAHYPETLDRIFIIGAPSFFPTVWGWIKRWFDPITVSKIFIIGKKEMKSTLERYIDVDNIPKRFGGNLDWDWGQRPNLDPAMSNILEWKMPGRDNKGRNGFPTGPVKWRRTPNGDMVAIAVGSLRGEQRHDILATLPAHERELNLATTLSNEDAFGTGPTTGNYTHPTDDQNHFPTSGNTPGEEHDEPILDPRVGARKPSEPSHGFTQQLPIRQVGSSTTANSTPREGTSTTRYMQQDQTHAQGQMAHRTPAPLHHGYGDKTHTVETATVGQAPKNVDVPERNMQPQDDNTYLGQAQALASSAISSATSALGTAESVVMNAVGMGTKQEEAPAPQEQHSQASSRPDPRVDRMENKNVEDFIRNQYATHPPQAKK